MSKLIKFVNAKGEIIKVKVQWRNKSKWESLTGSEEYRSIADSISEVPCAGGFIGSFGDLSRPKYLLMQQQSTQRLVIAKEFYRKGVTAIVGDVIYYERKA